MSDRRAVKAAAPAPSLAQLLNQSSRLISRLGDARLKAHGFRYAQVPVLALLKTGVALTQAELVARTGVEQSSMAQLLARMERDGLIERAPHPTDARVRAVTVTRKTAARLEEARQALHGLDTEAMRGLSKGEVETLVRLLTTVFENLEQLHD